MNIMNSKAVNVYVLKYWDDEDNRWEIEKVTSNNEEALKWDSRGHDYCFNGYSVEVEEIEKLARAKEIIKKFLSLRHNCKDKDCPCESPICETIDDKAEQFLKQE